MDNNEALQLVLGIALLLVALGTVGAWILLRWRRRPAVEATPAPEVSGDDAPTYAFEKIRTEERERFANELKAIQGATSRPWWLPPVSRARQSRWAERQVFLGDDRG